MASDRFQHQPSHPGPYNKSNLVALRSLIGYDGNPQMAVRHCRGTLPAPPSRYTALSSRLTEHKEGVPHYLLPGACSCQHIDLLRHFLCLHLPSPSPPDPNLPPCAILRSKPFTLFSLAVLFYSSTDKQESLQVTHS